MCVKGIVYLHIRSTVFPICSLAFFLKRTNTFLLKIHHIWCLVFSSLVSIVNTLGHADYKHIRARRSVASVILIIIIVWLTKVRFRRMVFAQGETYKHTHACTYGVTYCMQTCNHANARARTHMHAHTRVHTHTHRHRHRD